jgi:large subunit ribosomal protein L23
MNHPASKILLSPRITEKGAYLGERGAYVFNVSTTANKAQVAAAVKEIYKVSPRKVTLAAVPRKRVVTRGTNRHGKTAGGKKAYVYLKAGDTIELI